MAELEKFARGGLVKGATWTECPFADRGYRVFSADEVRRVGHLNLVRLRQLVEEAEDGES